MSLLERMRRIRRLTIGQQVDELNDTLRGRYAYYGGGGRRFSWTDFHQLKEKIPLLRSKLACPIGRCTLSRYCKATLEERGAGNPRLTFCGSRGRVTTPDDPVAFGNGRSLPRLVLVLFVGRRNSSGDAFIRKGVRKCRPGGCQSHCNALQ
jgi:hypothetical protein